MSEARIPLWAGYAAILVALAAGAAFVIASAGTESREANGTHVVLVTGFGPFGTYATNPAWESVRELEGTRIGGSFVRTARIDVEYAKAGPQIRAAIDAIRPDVVLCLGVAPDPWIRVETTARNRDTAGAADNAGVVRRDVPIREGGPDAIPTRLPVVEIVRALEAEGFEIRTSDDAGGYLCNHLFYELMSTAAEKQVAGFVHVPPLEGPWDLERLKRAVRRVVGVVAASAD